MPARDWVNQARQHAGPRPRLALVIQHTAHVAARTAAIKEVMRDAAATDPAVRQLLHDDDQHRYLTQQALVDVIIGKGSLRAGCLPRHGPYHHGTAVTHPGLPVTRHQSRVHVLARRAFPSPVAPG